MTAKEYLSQAFRLDGRINTKLEQVASLRNLAAKATTGMQMDRISSTRQLSPMENAVTKLIDLEHEINGDIDQLVDLKREIAGLIISVGDPSYRILLEMRYLGGNTWEEVSLQLGYDLRWVYRLHDRALQAVELRAEKK